MIETLTVLAGFGKSNDPDRVERVDLKMGEVVSIVGPTGSGKTTLIEDIELFANDNTPSRRKIMVNGSLPQHGFISHPANHPVALITQHTHFLSDMQVDKFLLTHAAIRGSSQPLAMVNDTLDFANRLTGEAIIQKHAMSELSGGQTRALLIADAVIIGNSPIILLDEIENAGIHRTRALELLKQYEKIFIFVTHDPRIALLSDLRIVMKNGAMVKIIYTESEEKRLAGKIKQIDDVLLEFRSHIRQGHTISEALWSSRMSEIRQIL